MRKLAIIGASFGQMKICEEANKMGLYTVGFAWAEGAICKDLFSKFYPVSIMEKDKIVDICREEKIDGVVSNGSDITSNVCAYISDKLGLIGNNYQDFNNAQNKFYVRNATNNIPELSPIKACLLNKNDKSIDFPLPCVVKPCVGWSKKGVCFIHSKSDVENSLEYAREINDEIMFEEFVLGREISVETLSYQQNHFIVQITDKDVSGAPHFVELGHHEPASINNDVKNKIYRVVPKILDAIRYQNGATHIEMKIDKNNNIYLVEINLRGGGDDISNKLVPLSTGFNYTKAMIEIVLGDFHMPKEIKNKHYAGIYYLCQQTGDKLKYFTNPTKDVIECEIKSYDLSESKTNYDRNGYLIYCGNKKLILE